MSEKIAILTDTNAGIMPETAKQMGIYAISMPVIIDGSTYFEGANLTHQQFYDYMAQNANISTSMPSPASVMEMWDILLKNYDTVLYIPMSSGLSSSCNTAMMLANEYPDKVYVVNNQRISVTMRQSVLDAIDLAKAGCTAAQIKEILEAHKMESSIYIMVNTLKYLKKGGRITPAVAAIGTLLRLKPVLQIQGEKLDTFSKARTVDNAMSIMLKQMKQDIDQRFGGLQNVQVQVAHSNNSEQAQKFVQIISSELNIPAENIYTDDLPLSICCHIGPGALAIACTKNLDIQ